MDTFAFVYRIPDAVDPDDRIAIWRIVLCRDHVDLVLGEHAKVLGVFVPDSSTAHEGYCWGCFRAAHGKTLRSEGTRFLSLALGQRSIMDNGWGSAQYHLEDFHFQTARTT